MNLAREIEKADRAAWRAYSKHVEACPLCSDIGTTNRADRCPLGRILDDVHQALDDLKRAPSRWATVEIVEWGPRTIEYGRAVLEEIRERRATNGESTS